MTNPDKVITIKTHKLTCLYFRLFVLQVISYFDLLIIICLSQVGAKKVSSQRRQSEGGRARMSDGLDPCSNKSAGQEEEVSIVRPGSMHEHGGRVTVLVTVHVTGCVTGSMTGCVTGQDRYAASTQSHCQARRWMEPE
jgi:hypothetical protein